MDVYRAAQVPLGYAALLFMSWDTLSFKLTLWLCSEWPRESLRPNTGKVAGLMDSRYLQSLNSRIMESIDHKPSLGMTREEKEHRRLAELQEEEELVRGLQTPHAGVREQLLEEVLRQLQGDGPMEMLEERLKKIDWKRRGTVRPFSSPS